MKAIEPESLFVNNDILCLTETQQKKMEKNNFSNNIKYIVMQNVKVQYGNSYIYFGK